MASRFISRLLGSLGLVLGSIVVGLFLLECGLRVWSGGYLLHWPNFVLGARVAHTEREQGRFIDDALLGYAPRPHFGQPGISFDGDGLRRNGADAAAPTPTPTVAPTVSPVVPPVLAPILATGDSYTFGDEVTDGETWPAHLQRLIGRRVLNAGVSGYGFDQAVLRAESLAARVRPSAIVVAFIADDLRRLEMRRIWGAEKPYFAVVDGRLVLRNVPVPPRPDPRQTLDFWQRTLGYSYLIQFLIERSVLNLRWFDDQIRVHPAGTGERIACLLTDRLRALQETQGTRVFLLAEYDPYVWKDAAFEAEQRRMTKGLLDCARQRGLQAVDSFAAMAAWHGQGSSPGRGAESGPLGLYGQWHFNDAGNALIAGLIAGALRRAEP